MFTLKEDIGSLAKGATLSGYGIHAVNNAWRKGEITASILRRICTFGLNLVIPFGFPFLSGES